MSRKKDSLEHSRFWLGEDFVFDAKNFSNLDIVKLAAYRKAVANFVMILTERHIPVKYAERNTSFTDGKVVTIGGELTKGEFDSTVGLALHEGAHIVLSDFTMLKTLWQKIPQSVYDAGKGKLSKTSISSFAKLMLNYVEDKFIDAWVYKNAPGYRGYYQSLYAKFFNNEETSIGLCSTCYRDSTLKNYEFRIINITNPVAPLDALPGLEDIYKKLDLRNILRLTTPIDRFNLACEIAEIVLKEIVKEVEKDEKDEEEGDKSEDSSSEGASDDIDDVLGGENGESQKCDKLSKEEELDGHNKKESPTDDVSSETVDKIEKSIKKQEDFINREMEVKSLSQDIINKLETLEDSNTDLVPVGGEQGVPLTNCVVVRNLTTELMESAFFPYASKLTIGKGLYEQAVQNGVALGSMLGRKLQIRNDSKTTRFTRLPKGKIDKRLISGLGFDAEHIFYEISTDQFRHAHVHLTIDASSSMESKWAKTLTTAVAMAKAASMVRNLDITISFRSGVPMSHGPETPYVLIAYDSTKDTFSKITQLFPSLVFNGSTPEGLAFEAIVDTFPHATQDTDVYFINLSDGEPYFATVYHGEIAWNHTKRQVDSIRQKGIQVLSYFLENQTDKKDLRVAFNTIAFKKMYGKDALFIDVDNVIEIAHTMNKKFTTR